MRLYGSRLPYLTRAGPLCRPRLAGSAAPGPGLPATTQGGHACIIPQKGLDIRGPLR
jgi:hypothetical protein